MPFDFSELHAAVRCEGGVSRRLFLAYGAAFSALPLLALRAQGQGGAVQKPVFPSDPFTLGVASGDPDASGFVLWTRLAPKPLEVGGGMTPAPVTVQWQVASDEGMKTIVKSGEAAFSYVRYRVRTGTWHP